MYQYNKLTILANYIVVQDFLKGGVQYLLVPSNKGHQILKGGVQWSDGGVQYISLPRTTNLAYLDVKE